MPNISKKEIYILTLLVIVGFVRYAYFTPVPPPYQNAVGQKVTVEGVVMDAPDVRLSSVRLIVAPEGQAARVLVVVPNSNLGEEAVVYGDKVRVSGVLDTPQNFTTSSGKEFNYERYLSNQDIYFIISNAKAEVLSSGHGNRVKSWLFKLRNSFMYNIGTVINPPESDLADGLVLGARGGFDSSMRDKFISTGTIHIIALSGYNVTIVAQSVMRVLGLFLSQAFSVGFGILVIILFIIMSGSSSTAVRAGVMAVIALVAQLTGRTYDAGRALVIAALFMIAYDLRVLTDISFQLSFIATFGVLYLTPKVIGWVKFFPMRFGLREQMATTLGATIAVLPILLYSTGILSLVSLPANIVILPFIPFTMLLTFIVGLLGFISTSLAYPFAYLAHFMLHYILSVIAFFASLPFASVTIQSFPLILTVVLYGVILWWGLKKSERVSTSLS
jgi:competence protein ComEC